MNSYTIENEHPVNGTSVDASSVAMSSKLDLGVDSVQSQDFGHGVFLFMLIGVIVFSAMIVALMFGKKHQPEKEKRRLGEQLMFIAIILGVIVAVGFGALQMLGGFLF